jgi:uncharacterized protein (DUF1800 family)
MNKLLPVVFSSLLILSACGGASDSGTAYKSDDVDGDTVVNMQDNCPTVSNLDQLDDNNDNVGNACDKDSDGVRDREDDFPEDGSMASSVTNAHRLLTQATFGATEAEIDNIVKIGTTKWLNKQLAKPSAYDNSYDKHKTHLERTIAIAEMVEPSVKWSHDGVFGTSGGGVPGGPIWHLRSNQISAWWENSLGHPTNTQHGSDQLRQRIAYSLSQLLVASMDNPRLYLRGESLAYYNDILAKNAFGNFRTLLGEVARSATMGVYLTYQGNQKADPEKSTQPDENFAREIIQLFTVGLYELNQDGSPNRDGDTNTYPDEGTEKVPTYTQRDVVELSKVMTGWDIKSNTSFGSTSSWHGEYAAQMEFFPEHHEDEVAAGGDGQVTVLGKTFALNSGTDGSGMDAALDVLFGHPNTAPFVSKHLITNLVTANPSSAYVARVASIFNDNGSGVKGDLRAVVKAVLLDDEARSRSEDVKDFGKMKEPFLAFTQLLRTFNVQPLDGWTGPSELIRGDGSQSTVNGVYTYAFPQKVFGQGPLRSSSVFNFYMPDYAPRDSHFTDNKMVSPETQIKTDVKIMDVHNLISRFVRYNEKNRITKISKKTLAEYAKPFSLYSEKGMIINYDRELALFEQALDGDFDGDFKKMTSISAREKAVGALLTHLDKVMLGNTMTAEFKEVLGKYLANSSSFSTTNKYEGAHHLISDAVRFIATSSAYMVQQ